MSHRLLFFVTVFAAASAVAQSGARPDPTAPQAPVPRIEYRSAFEGYRPFGDDKLTPWRESNESVRDAGAHSGHTAQPQAQQKPAAKSAPEHGQHGRQQ